MSSYLFCYNLKDDGRFEIYKNQENLYIARIVKYQTMSKDADWYSSLVERGEVHLVVCNNHELEKIKLLNFENDDDSENEEYNEYEENGLILVSHAFDTCSEINYYYLIQLAKLIQIHTYSQFVYWRLDHRIAKKFDLE
jgi:hypothetical protein